MASWGHFCRTFGHYKPLPVILNRDGRLPVCKLQKDSGLIGLGMPDDVAQAFLGNAV